MRAPFFFCLLFASASLMACSSAVPQAQNAAPPAESAPEASAPPEKPPPTAVIDSTEISAPSEAGKSTLLDAYLPPKVTSSGGSFGVGVASASGLTRTDIIATVEKASKKMGACYATLFKKPPVKKGKTSYDVVVDGSGKTRSAKLQSDEVNDRALRRCLETIVKELAWPRPTEKNGATVTLEWTMDASG